MCFLCPNTRHDPEVTKNLNVYSRKVVFHLCIPWEEHHIWTSCIYGNWKLQDILNSSEQISVKWGCLVILILSVYELEFMQSAKAIQILFWGEHVSNWIFKYCASVSIWVGYKKRASGDLGVIFHWYR